jgi:hypothetical protein
MRFADLKGRAFTRDTVLNINANQVGCYGIFNALDRCIYVGQGDIRDRMLAHVGGDNACIMRNEPNYWLVTVSADDEVEKKLIIEYQPVCNQRVG